MTNTSTTSRRRHTLATSLQTFVRRHSDGEGAAADPNVAGLLEVLHHRFGDSLAAVIIYGSYLRGKRDTVLDFYALLDNYRAMPGWQAALCMLLAPNVYNIHAGSGETVVRAKCATLSLARFERGMRRDFHSYFWARFAQPSLLVYCRDQETRDRVIEALAAAAQRFIEQAVPMLESPVSTRDLWVGGLNLTYRCELRAERRGYAGGLVDADPHYYRTLTPLLGLPCLVADDSAGESWKINVSRSHQRRTRWYWMMRRWQGKVLSVARIAKATAMFDSSLEYILWKIERHSGLHVEPTARQRRYPLLFAWPLLWRLYRRGAFR